jgi:hypothetical protein
MVKGDEDGDTGATPSRIPKVEFGTPQEDALRRDLTINSLFYNLHTGELEDFTGHGLSDLENGFIRTPFEALTTFKDDPLRILRLIRFACRYNMTIVDDVIKVLDQTCRNSDSLPGSLSMIPVLNAKISRERISDELDKMLSNDGYYDRAGWASSRERAISLLYSFNLLKRAMFVIPREVVHVPTPTALRAFFDSNGSSKAKRRAIAAVDSSSAIVAEGYSEDANYTLLNDQNCKEFDSFVDYGVALTFLLRTLEIYMKCHFSDAISNIDALTALQTEDAKYIRYSALAWWARDKCVLTGAGNKANVKSMTMAEYIFVVGSIIGMPSAQ